MMEYLLSRHASARPETPAAEAIDQIHAIKREDERRQATPVARAEVEGPAPPWEAAEDCRDGEDDEDEGEETEEEEVVDMRGAEGMFPPEHDGAGTRGKASDDDSSEAVFENEEFWKKAPTDVAGEYGEDRFTEETIEETLKGWDPPADSPTAPPGWVPQPIPEGGCFGDPILDKPFINAKLASTKPSTARGTDTTNAAGGPSTPPPGIPTRWSRSSTASLPPEPSPPPFLPGQTPPPPDDGRQIGGEEGAATPLRPHPVQLTASSSRHASTPSAMFQSRRSTAGGRETTTQSPSPGPGVARRDTGVRSLTGSSQALASDDAPPWVDGGGEGDQGGKFQFSSDLWGKGGEEGQHVEGEGGKEEGKVDKVFIRKVGFQAPTMEELDAEDSLSDHVPNMSMEQLQECSLDELRAYCKQYGLARVGRKVDLMRRLVESRDFVRAREEVRNSSQSTNGNAIQYGKPASANAMMIECHHHVVVSENREPTMEIVSQQWFSLDA